MPWRKSRLGALPKTKTKTPLTYTCSGPKPTTGSLLTTPAVYVALPCQAERTAAPVDWPEAVAVELEAAADWTLAAQEAGPVTAAAVGPEEGLVAVVTWAWTP